MSRLDRHIAAVRSKLILGTFVRALAWAILVFAAAVWMAILVDRLFLVRLPQEMYWFWGGVAAAVVAALVYALLKRPTAHEAAVAIDERLSLKEKFSTALYVRPSNDPFAMAALRDAEVTADNVTLHKQFPLQFPKVAYSTLIVVLLAGLTGWLMKPMDLFGYAAQQKELEQQQALKQEAKEEIQKALATVTAVPQGAADEEALQLAKRDLETILAQPIKDPATARRSAAKALQDVDEAIKQRIKESAKFAQLKNDQKMLGSLSPPTNETGPVADAHQAVAKGNFAEAIDKLQEAVENFDKMDKKSQEQAAKQMASLAEQLQQMAQNKQMQQQLEQKLQQMGANQQQAQQMAQQMQQAAAGDQQAQQQLQQQAQQMMQQMNNGQGPTPQQQQAMQQMMQQAQAMANTQTQAQQMAQAAQQMAQGMQQAAGQQGQQAQGQQGQGQAQSGQQQGQGQMAQGQQQMQQMLQQMQAMQSDAQQVAAAQQAMQQAAQQAMAGVQGGQCQGANCNGNHPGQCQAGGGQGQWKAGDIEKAGNGMGGPGRGRGGQAPMAQAPAGFKSEVSPSQDDDKGQILASTLVNAGSIKGESKAQLAQIAESVVKDATDEVQQEHVSHQAQKVVREYFESMSEDAR